MNHCAQQFGDIFQVDVGLDDSPLVIVSSPEGLQQLFSGTYQQFDSGKALYRIARHLAGEFSIGVLDGASHQRHRRLLLPPFHARAIPVYRQLIHELTIEAMERWQPGQVRSTSAVLSDVTLKVILQAVFGIFRGARYDGLEHLFSAMTEGKAFPMGSALMFFRALQVNLGPASPWGKFLRFRQAVDDLLYAEIAERRSQPDSGRTDVLSLLMASHDEEGQPMSDVELRDELMTLLHSGHSTTNASLCWALYFIHSHPEVLSRLLDELHSGFDPRDLSTADRLPYLQACIQETLRLYPPSLLALARIAREPTELCGYQFPAGTVFMPAIYLTHRRADLYPEPERFRPERFLERQYSPYEYLPFGSGNRMCVGYAFAQLQLRLILATMLSGWNLTLASDLPEKPGRRGLGGVKPAGGVPMRLIGPRRSALSGVR
jgi:cytochrome P450